MYSSYFAIGAIADGFGKKVYNADQVEKLMDSLGSMSAQNAKTLRKLKDNGEKLSEAEKKSIEEVAVILDLLKKEADAMTAFTKSKTKEDSAEFQKARKEVWGKIKTFLGLK